MNELSIIIINWNNTDTTLNCLGSVKENYRIVIVDNGSIDSELEKLKKNTSDNVHLILNDTNYGFASANNQGIKYAIEYFHPDYILLLNHDTLVTPDFVKPLISLMKQDQKIGAVQPKILRMHDKSIIDSVGQIMYSEGSVRDIGIGTRNTEMYQQRKEVFGACAAAVLYRTSALMETGLFDERLFILFEDVDISWRLRLKGYKIFYEPNSTVYHDRGISRPDYKEKKLKILQELYGFRNCLFINLKYYPLNYIIKFFPVHIYRFIIWLYLRIKYNIKVPFFKIIFTAIKERKKVQRLQFIRNIQRHWIVKVSYKDIVNIHK